MPRSRVPLSLGEALQQLIRDLGFEKRLEEQRLIERWPDVVGEQIAGHTRAVLCENGKLFVEVDSAAWRHELLYMKSMLLDRLNHHADKYRIHDIILTNRRK